MSRSLNRDDGFYFTGRKVGGVDPSKPILIRRRCSGCDTILSIYNPNPYCSPCSRKAVQRRVWKYGPCPWCGGPLPNPRSKHCSVACAGHARAADNEQRRRNRSA